MNDFFEILAVGCATTLFFSIPFIFFAFIRYLRYRETVALAEQGLLRPDMHRNGNRTMRWGMIFMFLGLALTLGLWPIGFMIDSGFLGLGPWLLPGLIPFFFGVALLAIHNAGASDENGHETDEEPIPPNKRDYN